MCLISGQGLESGQWTMVRMFFMLAYSTNALVADFYHSAAVTGVDLSPVQPIW
jgi:hypothetical protein